MDQLPPTLDIDMLRCLDEAALIEVCQVTMEILHPNRDSRFPRQPCRHPPFSPIRQPTMGGRWEVIMSKQKRDHSNHPFEVRVSERGRAELARISRSMSTVRDPAPLMRRPVLVAEVAKVAGKRPDVFLKMLRTRHYPIGGVEGAYVVEFDQALVTVPGNKRKQVRDWAEKNLPPE